jgi:hypothetical protein
MPKKIVSGIILLELVLGVSMLVYTLQPAKACHHLQGDVNKDGKIDGEDLIIVAKALGSYGPNFIEPGSQPHPRWNKAADVYRDNQINGYDLALVAMNLGKHVS